jgi:fatty-acyl-CoA synthase
LFPEQIAWIISHAQDRIVIADITFVPVLEQIAAFPMSPVHCDPII